MQHDAAVWLANHVNGPNQEKAPFGCFWCGGTVGKHIDINNIGIPCPAFSAIRQLDIETKQS